MQYSQFGALIVADPMKAHATLVALFAKHKRRAKVAEAIGSDDRTVGKWIKRLTEGGMPDPRATAGAKSKGVRAKRPSSLTDAQKSRMRARRREGWSLSRLAAEFGTTVSTAGRVCRGVEKA